MVPPPRSTLCPAGIAAMAPSGQKSLPEPCTEWPSRFQYAVFSACQMPLKLGCPAMVAGRSSCCACAALAAKIVAATVTMARMNRLHNACYPLCEAFYFSIFASQPADLAAGTRRHCNAWLAAAFLQIHDGVDRGLLPRL